MDLSAMWAKSQGERELPEQSGWAVEMHGECVLFANNAEKANGSSPGATTQLFTADQMRAAMTPDPATLRRFAKAVGAEERAKCEDQLAARRLRQQEAEIERLRAAVARLTPKPWVPMPFESAGMSSCGCWYRETVGDPESRVEFKCDAHRQRLDSKPNDRGEAGPGGCTT